MAVQAHYPSSNAFGSIRSNPLEEIQEMQHNINGLKLNPFGGYQNYGQHRLNGTTVFTEPETELTCIHINNASGSGRKRSREIQKSSHPLLLLPTPATEEAATSRSSSSFPNDMNTLCNTTDGASDPLLSPPIIPHHHHHHHHPYSSSINTTNLDLEAFIRHQNEKLRMIIEESRKKHWRRLVWMIEQETVKRLKEKERELEKVRRVNAHLHEKVKQMSAENEMWFNEAKNSEARVYTLRSSLQEQMMRLHHQQQKQEAIGIEEGFGETEAGAGVESSYCCNINIKSESEEREKMEMKEEGIFKAACRCKRCGGADVSVLLLPCRHLCVCLQCESSVESCPVCNSLNNATLRVFIS